MLESKVAAETNVCVDAPQVWFLSSSVLLLKKPSNSQWVPPCMILLSIFNNMQLFYFLAHPSYIYL